MMRIMARRMKGRKGSGVALEIARHVALWLSMIAVVGLASCPACLRTATLPGRASERWVLVAVKTELIIMPERPILIVFPQDAVPCHKRFHLRTHEAMKGILRRADDWLAPHIETRID